MFAKFENKIYWIRYSYTLTKPNTKSRKRKYEETILILYDFDSLYGSGMAVLESDCEKIDTSLSYSFESELETFLEKKVSRNYHDYDNRFYLKCSYDTSRNKEYYISSIEKVLDDALLVNLRNGDIRHFKFDKLYIAYGDGVTYD